MKEAFSLTVAQYATIMLFWSVEESATGRYEIAGALFGVSTVTFA